MGKIKGIFGPGLALTHTHHTQINERSLHAVNGQSTILIILSQQECMHIYNSYTIAVNYKHSTP